MKKIMFLMAMCLPMILLTSCSKDNDDDDTTSSTIIGKWRCPRDGNSWYYEFKSDGNCSYWEDRNSKKSNYKYRIIENKIQIDECDGEGWFDAYFYSITNNGKNLHLIDIDSKDDDDEGHIYIRM